jgi:hypothetical protein
MARGATASQQFTQMKPHLQRVEGAPEVDNTITLLRRSAERL